MVIGKRRFVMEILNTLTWEEFCDNLLISLYNMEYEHERYSGIAHTLTKDTGFDDFMRQCWKDGVEGDELRYEIEGYHHECLTST